MKVDVLYSGQLRFADACRRQKNIFISLEHKNIFSFLEYIQDSYSALSLKSTHMFDTSADFKTSLKYISEQLSPVSVTTFNRDYMVSWFEKTYNVLDPYQLFYIQHMYTFIEGLKHCTEDVSIAITSDLIIEGNLKLAVETVNLDRLEVYTHKNENIVPHIIVLNKQSREVILNNADDFLKNFFKKYDKEVWSRAENLWQCLFDYCGITVKTLKSIYQCKVKPTMTVADLDKSINMLTTSNMKWRGYKDSATTQPKFKYDKSQVARIVAYGCSYTAGDEFLDSSIHPDAEKIKKKNMRDWFDYKSSVDPALIKTLLSKQLNMAWPAILASRMSLAVDNRAIGGNSLPKMLYQVETDYQQGKILPKDIVLVGLTSYERNLYFSKTEPLPVLMHMKENFPPHLQPYQGPIADFNNSMFMFYFYYLTFFRLLKISESYLNGRMLIVPCINDANYRWFNDSLEKYFTKDILLLRNECLGHGSILTDLNLYSFVEDQKSDLHGGGHPKQIVHERFVNHLIDQLKAKKVF
jgi:hypothetical protein